MHILCRPTGTVVRRLFMQAGVAGNPWMRNMLVARALVYQAIAD